MPSTKHIAFNKQTYTFLKFGDDPSWSPDGKEATRFCDAFESRLESSERLLRRIGLDDVDDIIFINSARAKWYILYKADNAVTDWSRNLSSYRTIEDVMVRLTSAFGMSLQIMEQLKTTGYANFRSNSSGTQFKVWFGEI